MSLKVIGAVLVVFGCGGCGFAMAAAQKNEEYSLRQILRALDYMDCELQFRQTPLPQLCRNVSSILTGPVKLVFTQLAQELETQTAPDATCCVDVVLAAQPAMPPHVYGALKELGETLGMFDLQGQQKGMAAVAASCRERISELAEDRSSRLRSYQTLGLCAGAALAILFL